MSTQNICFCQEIRKILCGYPLLSVAMNIVNLSSVVFAQSVIKVKRPEKMPSDTLIMLSISLLSGYETLSFFH